MYDGFLTQAKQDLAQRLQGQNAILPEATEILIVGLLLTVGRRQFLIGQQLGCKRHEAFGPATRAGGVVDVA